MNKAELGARLATELSLTKATADRMLSAVFGESLANEEPVSIAGFGTFSIRARPARKGRNMLPVTGETIPIAASHTPAFNAGKALRHAVDKSRARVRGNIRNRVLRESR